MQHSLVKSVRWGGLFLVIFDQNFTMNTARKPSFSVLYLKLKPLSLRYFSYVFSCRSCEEVQTMLSFKQLEACLAYMHQSYRKKLNSLRREEAGWAAVPSMNFVQQDLHPLVATLEQEVTLRAAERATCQGMGWKVSGGFVFVRGRHLSNNMQKRVHESSWRQRCSFGAVLKVKND